MNFIEFKNWYFEKTKFISTLPNKHKKSTIMGDRWIWGALSIGFFTNSAIIFYGVFKDIKRDSAARDEFVKALEVFNKAPKTTDAMELELKDKYFKLGCGDALKYDDQWRKAYTRHFKSQYEQTA